MLTFEEQGAIVITYMIVDEMLIISGGGTTEKYIRVVNQNDYPITLPPTATTAPTNTPAAELPLDELSAQLTATMAALFTQQAENFLTVTPMPTEIPLELASREDTVFPLPEDVQGLYVSESESWSSGETISFRTSHSLDELVQFYRQEFASWGLTEREKDSYIGEYIIIYYDGHPSGKAIAVNARDCYYGKCSVYVGFVDK